MDRYSLVHLSDFHFCLQPNRRNIRTLWNDNRRGSIDTARTAYEVSKLDGGFKALLAPASYDPRIASKIAKFCFDRRGATDAILVTGDLACTGLGEDVLTARRFVEGDGSKVLRYTLDDGFPTISGFDVPVLVVPGNHDRYATTFATPGGLEFDRHIKSMTGAFGVGAAEIKKKGSALGIVAADLCLKDASRAPTSLNHRYGQGIVEADTLDRMREKTLILRARNTRTFIIWMIHFAPHYEADDLLLLNRSALIDEARRLKVDLVVCGHTHEKATLDLNGVHIICGGSACCVENCGEYTVHQLSVEIDGAHKEFSFESFVFNENSDYFVAA